jgi:Double zinc ribbon
LIRSPQLAALLDLFVWGAGHGFIGVKKALFFPWVVWTLALAVYNALGLAIWSYSASCLCGFYSVNEATFTVGVNYGALFAFILLPIILVGGPLAFDAYRQQVAYLSGGTITVPSPFKGFSLSRTAAGPAAASPTAGTAAEVDSSGPAATVTCPKCGTAATATDEFCSKCGASLKVLSPSTPATGMVCANCGTENPTGYAFCKRCGSKLT